MAQDNDNLIWLDMEMSGLSSDTDRILELAVVITDANLNVLGESQQQALKYGLNPRIVRSFPNQAR